MSHVQPTSNPTSAKPLDLQVREFTENIHANPSPRGVAMALEANQRLAEYLEALMDSGHATNTGITVKVDGQTIRFKNEEDFSNWLSERNNDNT